MFLWRMRAWTDFLQMTGTFVLTILFSIEVSWFLVIRGFFAMIKLTE